MQQMARRAAASSRPRRSYLPERQVGPVVTGGGCPGRCSSPVRGARPGALVVAPLPRSSVPTGRAVQAVAVVAGVMITGGLSSADLKAYAEQVKTRFKRDRRIAQVRILGFSEQDILIEIPAEVRRRCGPWHIGYQSCC